MGVAIEVNADNFATEVLARSQAEVVLVDFFAQWCGPCQMLKPVLEGLAQEYPFTLAKVDIDANPDLAQAYGVEGVPDVRVALNGELQTGFVGMLPEPQLHEFLAQLNLKSTIALQLEQARSHQQAGQWSEAGQLYQALLRDHPTRPDVAIATTIYLIATNQLETAQTLLTALETVPKAYQGQVQALQQLLTLKQDAATWSAAVEADEPYRQAIQAILTQNYETALSLLLELVRGGGSERDRARPTMLMIFGLLGDADPLTKTYRKALMQALY